MSIIVEVADLAGVLADRDPAAFLCTASERGVKVMHVLVGLDGDQLTAEVGRGSAANVTAGSSVTLVFAPVDAGSMSLLVDAEATVEPGEPPRLRLRPTGAIWHRSAHAVAS